MSKLLVSDEPWAVVEPLLPPESPKPNGGRPRMCDRVVLTGILFVLKSGIGGSSSGHWPGLNRFRRTTVRYGRRAELHQAFFHSGARLFVVSAQPLTVLLDTRN